MTALLHELIDAVDAEVRGESLLEISGLAYDSNSVDEGSLFFCVRGQRHDGHRFAEQALERGAAALVVDRELPLTATQVRVPDVREAMPWIASRFFGDPSRELRTVAVTGTNGKTTTSFMLRSILEQAGVATGLVGTIKRVIGGTEVGTVLTTPEAIDLQANMRAMLDAGDRTCVIEVSSHAISLNRADAIHADVAAFTNLSHEHLDFHDDMEDYFQTKRALFVPERNPPPRRAVVNVDDHYGRRLASELDCVTYSVRGRPADLIATDVTLEPAMTRFRCLTADGDAHVEIPFPGQFNAENALCAIAIACALGQELSTAAKGVASTHLVPGRFQRIEQDGRPTVIVDYAHTGSALEEVLTLARSLTAGRVISVFGCRGNRDPYKRPLMGAVAATHADIVIITTDSPGQEDPDAIIEEILMGISGPQGARRRSRAEVRVEPDRAAAIAHAIAEAGEDDLVLITGRGHEQAQAFAGGRRVAFDDCAVARDELRRRDLLAVSG